ncbi:MarR family winged helix-turn-helix transcriptional regulator [Dehalobacter sp.]|uniref:MarR family winged helix-turn-helix transcriptional regulator n=1 Tax=Dehalobacter sp. TaxID=1962289 RepID=UPI002582E0B0|nr:MarR family winged helix-turn-helix transcriptional regulator [Dehalobacter sp.]MDJ0305773.1 MarR family winged helix-turn-helix transcriptional regulator [Dehalobacter sp.]
MDKKSQITERRPSTCACQNLRRASLVITKIYNQKLSPKGLTAGQFSLLQNIKLLSPVCVSDLALKVGLDRTTLVRNLEPLEREDLIIDISPRGTRNRHLQLTDEGIKRYHSTELLWQEAQAFIEQRLGKDNVKNLAALLSEIETI